MKKALLPIITLFLCTLVLAAMPTEAEAAIYDDTVRLHILANSDSDYDQQIKLSIRDSLLLTYGDALAYTSGEEAEEYFLLHLQEIEDHVNQELLMLDAPYSAYVTLGEEWYDTREYEDFTLPSGIYTSLVIHLGEAEGRNWWCVMYPPLCLDLALDAPRDDAFFGYSESEQWLVRDGKYTVKFKTLELFSSIFSKKGK